MEFAEDSLFQLKQKFSIFKEKEVVEVVRQLLNGLGYLHAHGIVHADVKLENVMISNVKFIKHRELSSFAISGTLIPFHQIKYRQVNSLLDSRHSLEHWNI